MAPMPKRLLSFLRMGFLHCTLSSALIVCPIRMWLEESQEEGKCYSENDDQNCPVTIHPLGKFVRYSHESLQKVSHFARSFASGVSRACFSRTATSHFAPSNSISKVAGCLPAPRTISTSCRGELALILRSVVIPGRSAHREILLSGWMQFAVTMLFTPHERVACSGNMHRKSESAVFARWPTFSGF